MIQTSVGDDQIWASRAYGLDLRATFPLPGGMPLSNVGAHAFTGVRIEMVDGLAPEFSAASLIWRTDNSHGQPFELRRAPDGSFEMTWGETHFYLNPDRSLLLCSPKTEDDPSWKRELLDTVLVCTSLLGGRVGLHAAAVAGSHGAIAIVSVSGGGKSSVAGCLIQQGWRLVTDDVLVISDGGASVECGPPVLGAPRAIEAALSRRSRTLARFRDESWIEVTEAHVSSIALDAIVLLERTGLGSPTLEPLTRSVLPLLPHSLAISATEAEPPYRLEALARLVSHASILRLTTAPTVPPGDLADVILKRVRP